ncbi:SURF1 family protein [Gammaproteobacteria bacterium]|nr:SURF1 family protein [Gammaproteobacteria bacterium]
MSKFRPGKPMTIFVMFFFPILIFLGSWQVSRGIDKTDIVEKHYMNKSLPVINEKEMSVMNEDNLKYRTVNLYGEFGQESYLLDNRLYRQEAGYEVFTTFETSQNSVFLINRGWISKEGFNYDEDILLKDKGISIQGLLSPFTRFGLNLVDESYVDTWPKLVQQIDYEAAKKDLGSNINNSVIQLSAGSSGALEPIWKPVDLKPSRHYGYALQWFGLAIVLICSFFYYGFKKD